MSGMFVTFEGIEGCGKSTQVQLLHRHLEGAGHEVVVTREPGGTPIAEAIRALLLDPQNGAMDPRTELLLYAAARAQHVAERIRPALEAGAVVICDRFADSTSAYQGAGRGLPEVDVDALHALATSGLNPDLTLLLDVPVEVGLRRVRGAGAMDRIEQEDIAFHERVREGFLALARELPERVLQIDGTAPPDEVAAAVSAQVDTLIESKRSKAS